MAVLKEKYKNEVVPGLMERYGMPMFCVYRVLKR